VTGDTPGKVVVGVSSSLAGLQALRYAVRLAREHGVPLHAVRAWTARPSWRDHPNTDFERRVLAAESELLIPYVFDAAMGGPPPGTWVEPAVLEGPVGPSLVRYADGEADVLVLGGDRRGSHPFRRVGPVTRFCVRHAYCPVLVVPPPVLAQAQPLDALVRELSRDIAR
jgi:nucleotide-binding universal stress UspA family protein